MFPKHSHMAHQRQPCTCKNSRGLLSTQMPRLPQQQTQQYVPSYLKHQKADGVSLYVDRSRQVSQSFKGLHMCTDTLASVNSPDKKLIHSVTKKKKKTTSKVDCREPLKSCWVYVTPMNSHKYFEGTLEYCCLFKTNPERTLR